MSFNRISWASLAILSVVPALAQTSSEPVAEVANIRFYSNELLNLHHTLYAAAWAGRTGRTEGRVLAQKLPHPLTAPLTPQERVIWDQAVHYYDAQIADRDPLSGPGMQGIKAALASGKLDDPAIDEELRATLKAARPVFDKYFWPEHDRVNRAWIAAVTDRVTAIAPEVIPRLEKTYDSKWFSTPVRADAVWVGHWGTAYTSLYPPHSVLSSTDPAAQGWSGAEVIFHEFSHALNFKLQGKFRVALGEAGGQHATLWHATQFYLTGEVVREVLALRKTDYSPMLYSLGLFDTLWPHYRTLIEANWGQYLQGRISMDDAVAGTVIVLRLPVAEVVNIRFYSDELLNLHHTLYAAAWAGRTQGFPLAQKLPHALTAPLTQQERAVWEQAVQYYDTHLASRDLNGGPGMAGIKMALILGNLSDPSIDRDLRATLQTARPVFHKYFWPEQDRANRAWIASVTGNVKAIAPEVVPRLEKAYETKWFSAPVRADAVWVGKGGGYTTLDPTHSTISSTDQLDQEWSGVETVFHELSHPLVRALTARLAAGLGDDARQNGTLWHAIQFYLAGTVIRDVLADRNIDYTPMVYSVMTLFPGGWRTYRVPIEEAWGPYLQGSYSMDEAIARTVKAVTPSK